MKATQEHIVPIGFYDPKKWYESIVNHYSEEGFPKEALSYPIEALTASFANIINVYGNYPEDIKVFLSQATNPLFSPEEYQKQIYSSIKEHAKLKKDPYIDAVAESLYFIRLLFEQDKEYICEHFKEEMSRLSVSEGEDRADKFSKKLSDIVKSHAKQISKMVSKYCDVN